MAGTPVVACWSDETTATLVEEWGRRYETLNHLRKNDWQEVADAVNAAHETELTEVQCRNRIDTIKKKYKAEKKKASSSWSLFNLIDSVINHHPTTAPPSIPASDEAGPSKRPKKKKKTTQPQPQPLPQPQHLPQSQPQPQPCAEDNGGPQIPPPPVGPPIGDDWAVFGKLLEGSSLPKSFCTSGLALVDEDQKADIMAEYKEIILSELELSGKKHRLISNLKKLIFEAID